MLRLIIKPGQGASPLTPGGTDEAISQYPLRFLKWAQEQKSMTFKEYRRWQRFHWFWVREDWRYPKWHRGWVHYNGLPGLLDPVWKRPWWKVIHDKLYCVVWGYCEQH